MLQASTLAFLAALEENNNREWFDANRHWYDAARGDFEAFAGALKEALCVLVPELEGQPTKSLLFRTYRDVRFSKDKTPYKTHFSAYYSRAGKKAVDAGFYLHIRPGHSHFSAGMWEPQGAVMKAVRQEIDYSLDELEGLLKKPAFRKTFGELRGETLRTLPQGYTADNPAIGYLKHKSFLVKAALPDAFLLQPTALKKLLTMAKEADPLVRFLNRAMDDAG